MRLQRTALLLTALVLLLGVACGDSSPDTDAGAAPSATPSPAASGTPCDVPVDERANGLIIEDVLCGSGAEAKNGDILVVHYTGTFEDGTVFDTSKKPGGQPFPVQLGAGNVIRGWDIGLVGMQAGGTRKLTIPPQLAYGPNDYNGIPGGSTLIFEVELLQIQPQ
ncbi:MAG: FK506-binding nuclear protein [Actinomycetota bacterium]|jgi:FKBP-type peptidyl-prolyl cis-trans isomerase|nr:FK506-binding nuclear protein [Actinomycetota bacterium]